MLRIAGLAALVTLPLVGVTHGPNLRDLYDQMYPVNTLKRDAFDLCHESDPNFVRALDSDRVSCYNRMPNSIAMAIGYQRPGDDLVAFGLGATGFRAAMLLAAELARPVEGHFLAVQPVMASFSAAKGGDIPPCSGLTDQALASAVATIRALPADQLRLALNEQGGTLRDALQPLSAILATLPPTGSSAGVASGQDDVLVSAGDAAPLPRLEPAELAGNASSSGVLSLVPLMPPGAAVSGTCRTRA